MIILLKYFMVQAYMKILYFMLMILTISGCSHTHKTSYLKLSVETKNGYKRKIYRVKFPADAQPVQLGNTHGRIFEFWGKDSVLLYISDDDGATYYSENISIKDGLEAMKNHKTKLKFAYSGRTEYAKNWKEIRTRGLKYGYYNVPDSLKNAYDSYVDFIR